MGKYKFTGHSIHLKGYGRVRTGRIVEGDFGRVPGMVPVEESATVAVSSPSKASPPTPPPTPPKKAGGTVPVTPAALKPATKQFPIQGYDDLNVGESLEALDALTDEDQIIEVRTYEEVTKKRKGVLKGIAEILEEFGE